MRPSARSCYSVRAAWPWSRSPTALCAAAAEQRAGAGNDDAHAGVAAPQGLSRQAAGGPECHRPASSCACRGSSAIWTRSWNSTSTRCSPTRNGVNRGRCESESRSVRGCRRCPPCDQALSARTSSGGLTVAPIGECVLRPMRPEDAPAIERLFARLTPEDVACASSRRCARFRQRFSPV